MAAISSPSRRALLIVSLIPLLLFGASCSGGEDNLPLGAGATTPISVGGGSPAAGWHPMFTGTEELLWGISGTSAGEAITVGTRATALHLEENGWMEMPTGEVADLCDVWMSASGHAIAIAD